MILVKLRNLHQQDKAAVVAMLKDLKVCSGIVDLAT